VKLLKASKGKYQIFLEPKEKDLLLLVLRLYPRIPAGHQPLSKTHPEGKVNQGLLDDALAEARSENRKALDELLSDSKRVKQEDAGWRFILSAADIEWLLLILNDVRIGSWIELGSPECPLGALSAQNAPAVWAMEMAGAFQMAFLELLEA
jgi:hypothetical protein